jgi:sugar/nucleoside kinase (ribokinase family)
MASFIAVGDLMVDISVVGRGHDARVRLSPGGTAANAAVWAASLGAAATVVGRAGDDPAGRMLRAELEARGVNAAVAVDPQAPTGTFLTVDGEIRADRGGNARLEPTDLPQSIEGDAVLVSGYVPVATVRAALARANAAWVALDAARLTDLPEGGNALLANEDRARALTGRDPEQAARLLAGRYRLACVTRGPAGAVAVVDGVLQSAPSPRLRVVDPTGAGDAFAAGLLVALARGEPLAEALAEGCLCGARAAGAADPWPPVLN